MQARVPQIPVAKTRARSENSYAFRENRALPALVRSVHASTIKKTF
jgi:hypothetical protein